jgi:small-conductance mechanosensitive channel
MDQPEPPLLDQLTTLWSTASGWLTAHSARIAMAAILGAAIVLLLYGAKLFGLWLCGARRAKTHWPGIVGQALAKTRLWFMVAVATKIIVSFAHAPADIALPVQILFVVASALQAAVWARALILGIVEYRAVEADPSGSLGSAVGIIRLLVTVTLFLLAAILILANLGVDVTGLLAGLGIGGIAIGLAAQGIFSDLFAALSILFDKPFRRGDIVRWDTTTGTVEAIGLKSSRIRAMSGEEIIISNANLLGKELHNFARLETRRISQPLALVYTTPLATCEALGGILEPVINGCDGCTFQRCGLETFGASSLDFMLVYDIEATDQADVLARRNTANLAVLRAFTDHGIAFAYPTQTTYTAAPDGTLVMPYAQPSAPDIVKRK